MSCELPDWFCRPPAEHTARYVLTFTCGHEQAICHTGFLRYWLDVLAYRYNCRCHVCKVRPVQIFGIVALPVGTSESG